MICLGTNAVIDLLGCRDPKLRARFEAQIAQGAQIALPAVCRFELRYGHAKSR